MQHVPSHYFTTLLKVELGDREDMWQKWCVVEGAALWPLRSVSCRELGLWVVGSTLHDSLPSLPSRVPSSGTLLETSMQMVSECAAQAGKLQFLLTRKEFKGQITQAATICFDCLIWLWPVYQMWDLPTDCNFILKALRPYFGATLRFGKLELSRGVCVCPVLPLHGVLCGPALAISCYSQ